MLYSTVCIHGDIIQCVWGGNWNNQRKPYDPTEGFELSWIGRSNLMGLFCDMVYLSMITSSHGSIFCVTGPLCGEVTGEFPSQRPVTQSLNICFLWSAPWINGWVNNREAGDLRRYCAHYDIIVMERGQRALLICFWLSVVSYCTIIIYFTFIYMKIYLCVGSV